ncbi:MAG: hypothetical protein KatS3mg058_0864 [Roseiflexus sp.]|nr:MAG: hypothetical protein KatS3mg058_0864 [Roseiflexus sp.]
MRMEHAKAIFSPDYYIRCQTMDDPPDLNARLSHTAMTGGRGCYHKGATFS